MINNILITKDIVANKLIVTREFNAPVEKVWQAWTESELLDEWWAPRPWKAETKLMDFTQGGKWLYAMIDPEAKNSCWCRVDFTEVGPGHKFSSTSLFCDENGNALNNMPQMHWINIFKPMNKGTIVEMEINFDNETDLKTIIEMGFEAGFTMGLNNLDELLAK